MRILLTGATGYVGGRLLPRLLQAGHDVTVFSRDSRRIKSRPYARDVQTIEGDLLQPGPWQEQLQGFDTAYYLVHSMLAGRDFDARDQTAARCFAEAVQDCPHIIYLGGLQPRDVTPSLHLASRAATGKTLERVASGKVTEFRAGPIIGSGSASFEMVRYLTERLPIMLTPKWVKNQVQPIAIRDVLSYLIAALDTGPQGIIDIGADVLRFVDLMQVYAQHRGLSRRIVIHTPFLAPGLAARWVGFTTPITNKLAVPLVEGLIAPLLADTAKARRIFPNINPTPFGDAVDQALQRMGKDVIETRWSDSLGDGQSLELADEEGMLREVRRVKVNASAEQLFAEYCSIGGDKGWPAWNWAWRVRGWIDKIVGGPGLRRGRRDPNKLYEGEALDFWRVERVNPPALLRLRAEMKLPGKAWLQFETRPISDEQCELIQTALFEPKGLPGIAYWYASLPLHLLIFSSMARTISSKTEERTAP